MLYPVRAKTEYIGLLLIVAVQWSLCCSSVTCFLFGYKTKGSCDQLSEIVI